MVSDVAHSPHRVLRWLRDSRASAPILVGLLFFAVDAAGVGKLLVQPVAVPTIGYLLLSALLLAILGWLGCQTLGLLARYAVTGIRFPRWVGWLIVASLSLAPALKFAFLMTAGRGISMSPWKSWVFAAAIILVETGALLLVWAQSASVQTRPKRRIGSGIGFLVAGIAGTAITTFHSTTYLSVHLGFLIMASILLQAGFRLVVELPKPLPRLAGAQLALGMAGVLLLLGGAYGLSRLGSRVRANVGLVLFSRTLAAQKLTAFLFRLSPVQTAQSSAQSRRLLSRTRLSPVNPPPVAPLTPGKFAGYNVIWISSDAFRADFLGKTEQGATMTPQLDALRKQSVVFTDAIADHSHTARSTLSLVAARWSTGQGMGQDARAGSRVASDRDRLPRLLRKKGYLTIANMMGGRWGKSFFTQKALPGFEKHSQRGPDCGAQVDDFERSLSRYQKRAPWFTWMHFFDTHRALSHEHRGAGSDEGAYENYVAGVRAVDGCVGRVMAALSKAKLWDKTLVVFFADHGEALGEHDRIQRHSTCYLHDIRIPLIFRVPGRQEQRLVSYRAQISDLLPTTFNLIGVPTEGEYIEGDDLSGLFDDQPAESSRGVAFSRGNASQYPCASVMSDQWHLIYTDSGMFYELYDVDQDPEESNNLMATQGAVADRLRPLLDAYFAQH